MGKCMSKAAVVVEQCSEIHATRDGDFDSANGGGTFFLTPTPSAGKLSNLGRDTTEGVHSEDNNQPSALFPGVSRISLGSLPADDEQEQVSPNLGYRKPTYESQSHGTSSYHTASLKRTQSSLIVHFDDIWFGPQLGYGPIGEVFSARWLGKEIAIKIHDVPLVDEDAEEAFVQALQTKVQWESQQFATISTAHVIAPLGFCLEPPCVIMEHCARGSMFHIIERAREDLSFALELTWGRRLRMLSDAAAGMVALHGHSPAFLHRNLKSNNLLVDSDWRVKVSDLGLFDKPTAETLSTGVRWLAAEVLEKREWIAASDIYSFGVIMWQMLTWELPWGHLNSAKKIRYAILGGEQLPLPERSSLPGPSPTFENTHIRYYRLMDQCMEQDPEIRPDFIEILRELTGMAAKESV